jgi:hypothetical protein
LIRELGEYLERLDDAEWNRVRMNFLRAGEMGQEVQLLRKKEEATWDKLRTKWASKHRTRVITIEWKAMF